MQVGTSLAGVRFTSGYVSAPICAPTRAGLLTGRYQQRFGFETNPGPEAAADPKFGLPRAETTLAERLKAAGYATGMVGKWHVGFKPELQPTARGFDEFFGFLGGANNYLPAVRRGAARSPILRGTQPVTEQEYLTDAFGRGAVAFIEKHRERLRVFINDGDFAFDPSRQGTDTMKTIITLVSLSALLAGVTLVAQQTPASTASLTPNKAYDPSLVPLGKPPAPLDLRVTDANRQRDVPILVYLPADTSAAPLVLFSHGLGGNRQGSAYLGRHWAVRGYVVVFLQHTGSDDGVWKNQRPAEIDRAMRDAASVANLLLRVTDVGVVLDQLARWQATANHPLAGRLDLRDVGMSGHSFGAITTQAVSGQTAPGGGQPFTDHRIKAAIAFSPSEPATGSPTQAFGRVAIPWLLMTGTKDVARLGGSTLGASHVQKRLSVFPALPPGSKYELVLHDAEHSAFTGRALPGDSSLRNPNHHRAILALSTAFWDAYLKGDAAARAWLDGTGPRSVLEVNDRWQAK